MKQKDSNGNGSKRHASQPSLGVRVEEGENAVELNSRRCFIFVWSSAFTRLPRTA